MSDTAKETMEAGCGCTIILLVLGLCAIVIGAAIIVWRAVL